MTTRFKLCLKAAATLNDADAAALADSIQAYRAHGMDDRASERAAVADLLAQVEQEQKDITALLRQQHPQSFTAQPVKRAAKALPNAVFTEDAAAKAREILRKKLGQLNSGLDPEVIQAGITLAGYHIERGARTFAAYARAMVADLGDMVKPYLKSWYMAAKYDPRLAGVDGLSPAGDVEAADINNIQPLPADNPWHAAARVLADRFLTGESFPTIVEARRGLAEASGQEIKAGTESAKRADEAIELAVVMAARDVVAEGQAPAAVFDRLVGLYEQQPSLNVRTSTSIEDQAYSTPVPLAYVASQLAGINERTSVYEPSGGNGALVIGAATDKVAVNELNEDRRAALQAQGLTDVTPHDAATFLPARKFDVVVMNPPFGVVRGGDGKSKVFSAPSEVAPNGAFETTEIDHAIALQALQAMKPDGSAALIVGAPNKLASDRSEAYNGAAKRRFYFALYKQYNVVDHFTVSGDLYKKQGAAWPVDVIVIRGKGASSLPLPAAQPPAIIESWTGLKEKLNDAQDRLGAGQRAGEAGGRSGVPAGSTTHTAAAPEPLGREGAGPGASPGTAGAGQSGGRVPGADGLAGSAEQGAIRVDGGGQPIGTTPGAGRGAERAGAGEQGAGVGPGGVRGGQPGDVAGGRNGGSERQPVERRQEQEAEGQVSYEPASKVGNIGTLVPVNMQSAVADALKELQDRAGPVDAFVAQELDYEPGEIGTYFSAEQVDALGLAIDNLKRGGGFIIGDQTGIGKGRVNAGIMRWAIKNGKTPIFVTHKPNLYADMHRDLTDIGMPNVSILMTNGGLEVPLGDSGDSLKTPGTKQHNADLQSMIDAGSLRPYDVVFSTYDSLNTVKGSVTPRMELVRRFADKDGILILDESHNAGGSAAEGGQERAAKGSLDRSKYFRQLVASAGGVFYSSATYAKRPSVMDLYAKTEMRLAVNDPKEIGEAIAAGGVPLQQAVAAMLARSGQYIRRERTFAGLRYDMTVTPVSRPMAENTATIMRGIMAFDGLKAVAVQALADKAKSAGEAAGDADNAVGAAGASSTNFTSLMHNLVGQMLLGLKIQPTVDAAIAAIEAGEKPVITVANTMESMLNEFAEANEIHVGDAIDMNFGDLLMRYLERSRMVTIKDAFGGKTKRRMDDHELGPVATAAFNDIKETIERLDFSAMPISPIDYLKAQLMKRGYKTAEITGRSGIVDYSGDLPAYRVRPAADLKIAGRLKAISDFNNGAVDVMILNQAGSTGLSLHASPKVGRDTRRRHMIIAQAELNIDTHMQMLGRVHRTGQVIAPRYTQFVADVPAEKRPAAVLAKKMASLNANTTSARKNALMSDSTPDFINQYGDEVAAALMADDEALHKRLGEPLNRSDRGDGFEVEAAARKVTGRIPLLPLAEQDRLYALLESEYRDLIAQKNALGENALEAKTLALDARPVATAVLLDATGTESEFQSASNIITFDVKRLGKPYTPAQVDALSRENATKAMNKLDLPADALPQDGEARMVFGARMAAALQRRTQQEFSAYERGELADLEPRQAQTLRTRLGASMGHLTNMLHEFPIGQSIELANQNGMTYRGTVLNIERKGTAKNPAANGAWKWTFALADAARQITVPISRIGSADGQLRISASTSDLTGAGIDEMLQAGQTQSRENRAIITGNLLKAYAGVKAGQIVNFTLADGSVQQGIMMGRGVDAGTLASSVRAKAEAKVKNAADAVAFLRQRPTHYLEDRGSGVSLKRERSHEGSDWVLSVGASKSSGGDLFLDADLRAAVGGDFIKRGGSMVARFDDDQLDRVLAALVGKRPLVKVDPMKKAAATVQMQAAAPSSSSAAPAEPATTIDRGGLPTVEHTTAKGKVITGIVRKDLSQAQAKEIDPYTFKKDGGWFIREKYVKPDDAALSRATTAGGLPVASIRQMLDSLASSGLRSINVLASPAGLPLAKRSAILAKAPDGAVRGAYFRSTDEIFLFADNLKSLPEAVFVALHEGFHRGLHITLGDEGAKVLRQIYATNKRVRELADANMREFKIGKEEAINEALADLAGAGEAESLKGWAKLARLIREWIAKIADALGVDLHYTDAMVSDLIAKMTKAGLKGGVSVNVAPAQELAPSLSFAGPLARTADMRTLSDADKRLAAGDDAETVRQDTGWFRGPDGKWRFEINDADAKLTLPSEAADGRPMQLSTVLDHPALFAAYPHLAGLQTTIAIAPGNPVKGQIARGAGAISVTAPTRSAALSVLLHEVQHGIQTTEGFARGGGKSEFARDLPDGSYDNGYANYARLAGEVEARNTQARQHLDDTSRRVFSPDMTADVAPSDVIIRFNGKDAERAPRPANFGQAEEAPLLSRHTPEERAALARAGIAPRRRLGDHIRRAWDATRSVIADRGVLAQSLRQGSLDQFYGIRRAVAHEVGNLPMEQDPYITARLANGGTSSVMRALLLHGQAQWSASGQHLEKKPGTEGLLDILKPLGDDLNDWFGWMIGNRAARLKGERRENNFTDDHIAALQGLANTPAKLAAFRAAALKYAAFKRSVLDIGEAAGIINADTRAAWDNADYIPFYRQIDERASFNATGRKGLAGQSSGIRTLRGGEAALNDPIENLLMNFSRIVDASLKNNAIRRTVDVLEQAGSSAIEKVGYDMTAAIVPRAQIEKQLIEAGTPPQILAVLPPEAFEGMAKMWAIRAPTDPSVIRIMRDGKPQFYRVNDPLLLKAATSFVPFDFPGLGVMRMFKRVLTATVTATPEFMLRNFIRDSAAVQGISRTGVNPAKSVAGIVKAFRENGAAEHMLFAGASFQSGNINAADPTGTATAVRRALRQKGMDATSADRFIASIVDKPARLWEMYRHMGEAVENANREAMFEATTKAGGSVTAAAFESKDLMDFSLRGSNPLYQLAADVLPFFNARVQGLYRLGRSDPKRLAAYAGIMTTLSVALVMANSGQDWYDELPDWDKDTYWHFRIGGQHFRIPKPFELGVAFATIPERIARYLAGQDTTGKMGGRLWANVRDQLAFDPIPQALRPAANVWANKDTFRDAPIETRGDEQKLPHLRAGPRTSATAQTLLRGTALATDRIGLSPKKLEYLVGGYFGTAGLYALGLSDMAVRALEGYPPQPTPRVDDLPVVRAFVRADPARSTVFESDLYKIREHVDEVYRSVKALEKDDKADQAKKLADANPKEMDAHRSVDLAARDLAKIRKDRNEIYADKRMTPDQKRVELDKLQALQNRIAKEAMRDPAIRALQ